MRYQPVIFYQVHTNLRCIDDFKNVLYDETFFKRSISSLLSQPGILLIKFKLLKVYKVHVAYLALSFSSVYIIKLNITHTIVVASNKYLPNPLYNVRHEINRTQDILYLRVFVCMMHIQMCINPIPWVKSFVYSRY